jgi:hypothetical protein
MFLCLTVGLWQFVRGRLERELSRLFTIGLALAGWQAVSPAFALWRGVVHAWPRSGRYGQFVDTLGPVAAAAAGTLGVPWAAVGGILALGWTLSTGLGAYQHFVRWPFGQPGWMKTPVERVREAFGSGDTVRYAAGGLLFHRLRFAHGAVAALGLFLGGAVRAKEARQRLVSAVLVAVLLTAIYLAFARAAFAAALAMLAVAMVGWLQGRARLWALGLGALLALGVAVSPGWRGRLFHAEENVAQGERHLAMGVGLRLVRAHPIVGVGFGNHQPVALETASDTGITPFLANDSHDLWITTWAETGVVGLALLVAYQALLGRLLWMRARAGSWVALGALLSWLGFHLLSLVHYLPYHTGVYLSFGLIWGLGLVANVPASSVQSSTRRL